MRRVDITLTHTGGSVAEHLRTQHFTFRPAADGLFAEDMLYRNLHPMLAKRFDLVDAADEAVRSGKVKLLPKAKQVADGDD